MTTVRTEPAARPRSAGINVGRRQHNSNTFRVSFPEKNNTADVKADPRMEFNPLRVGFAILGKR